MNTGDSAFALPVELWQHVVTSIAVDCKFLVKQFDRRVFLEVQRDLRNVCLVPRTFRTFAQPKLFQLYSCQADEDADLEPLVSRAEGILSLIKARPEVGAWFKIVKITLPSGFSELFLTRSQKVEVAQLRCHLCQIVPQLPTSITLEWRASNLPREIYAYILKSRNLRTVILRGLKKIEECTLNPEHKPASHILLCRFALRYLGCRRVRCIDSIARLIIKLPLQTLTTSPSVIRAALRIQSDHSSPFSRIKSLSVFVTRQDLDYLPSALEACPSLLVLNILGSDGDLDYASSPLISGQCVPQLEEFYGPPSFVSALVPGRPVRLALLRFPRFPLDHTPVTTEEYLHALSLSSANLIELTLQQVEFSNDLFANIFKHLPSLRRLNIEACGWYDYLKDLVSCVEVNLILPKLEHLRCSAHNRRLVVGFTIESLIAKEVAKEKSEKFDPETELAMKIRRLLESSNASFPSLGEVDFQGSRWSKNRNGGWRQDSSWKE